MSDQEAIPERATTFALSGAHPMLSVADVQESVDYYCTVLGFFLEWAATDDDGTGLIANLWRGELSLFLVRQSGFGPTCVFCHLDDQHEVDDLYHDLVAAGAEIEQGPKPRSWGLYEMRVSDQDGNQFRFACSLPEQS